MARRDAALIPLTHDHHHALAQARTLLSAASGDDQTRRTAAEAFLRFYRDDTLLHFHEEEEVLFPKLLEYVDEAPDDLTRVLVDHVRIHGMVARLGEALREGTVEGRQLEELGATLRDHVRIEESRLFPLIERLVPRSSLDDITFAPRRRAQE